MWTLTLLRVCYVASGVSQWVHERSSWLYGVCDVPLTKSDALNFALPATRGMAHICRVITAVAKHRAQHTLKLCVTSVLVWDVHKCFTYVPDVNHWDLRDLNLCARLVGQRAGEFVFFAMVAERSIGRVITDLADLASVIDIV